MRKTLPWLILALAVLWHASAVRTAYKRASRNSSGADFATYYYAAKVAQDGKNPYVKAELGKAAREDKTRRSVHPFFYPPPFVAATAWVTSFSLQSAYLKWFWLDELALWAFLAVMGVWWREQRAAMWSLAVLAMVMTAVPNNHVMGQVNLSIMALAFGGVALEKRRPIAAGALVGLACMLKMSPAFLVMWWLVQRRWTASASACVTAVVLSVLSLPWVGFEYQLDFYQRVLPAFGAGSYNGLTVGIDLFGNHSVANLLDEQWPAGPRHHTLSDTARRVGQIVQLIGLGVVLWFSRRRGNTLATSHQVAAIAVLMLLTPVFTYEHHLVWALPAMALAMASRRTWGWGVLMVLVLGLCYDLAALKSTALSSSGVVYYALREWKFVALVGLLGWNLREGR